MFAAMDRRLLVLEARVLAEDLGDDETTGCYRKNANTAIKAPKTKMNMAKIKLGWSSP